MEEKGQDEVKRTKKGADCTGKVMLLCERAVGDLMRKIGPTGGRAGVTTDEIEQR